MRFTPRRLVVGAVLVVGSVALGLVVAVSLFLNSSRTVVLVGHDTVVRPTLARDAVVETGPLLPDLRFRDVGPLGVTLTLGKTEVGSIEELVQRYALIASDPTVPVEKVRGRRPRHGSLGRPPRPGGRAAAGRGLPAAGASPAR